MRYAMNHITTPKLSLRDFFALSRELGIDAVEIRNDLPNIVGTMSPEEVKAAAASGVLAPSQQPQQQQRPPPEPHLTSFYTRQP